MVDKEIYLVRHGETDWNLTLRCQGDPSLNSTGISQAKKTGEYFAKYRETPDCIFISTMKRASETADHIMTSLNYTGETIYMKELEEQWMGNLAGTLPDNPVRLQITKMQEECNSTGDPIDRLTVYKKMFTKFNQENNLEVETYEDFDKRALRAILEIANSAFKRIIVVSHGKLIRSMLRQIFNVSHAPTGINTGLGNCQICYLKFESQQFKMLSAPTNIHLS